MTDIGASAAHWLGVDDSKYLALIIIIRVNDNGLRSVCAKRQHRDVLAFSVDPWLR